MACRIVPAVAALLALAGAGLAQTQPTVTVTLEVHANATAPFAEPAFRTGCPVAVPAGSNGSVLLDRATDDGCIDGWDHVESGGRFLTAIEGPGEGEPTDGRNTFSVEFGCGVLSADPGSPKVWSWWTLLVDGTPPSYGIDGYNASAGDVVELHYLVDDCSFARTIAFFETNGTHAHSPVPLQGNTATDPGA